MARVADVVAGDKAAFLPAAAGETPWLAAETDTPRMDLALVTLAAYVVRGCRI